jgi:hypothetical protein
MQGVVQMKFPICLALLPLVACAQASGPVGAIGQTAAVEGIKVRPLTLLEDSRCPKDVNCFWAGQVRIHALVSGGTWQIERDLTQGKPIPVADGTLELTSVEPERRQDTPIALKDYRFTFRFSGGL